MFNITNVKNDFAKIRFGDPFQEYSRVEMNLSDEEYVATGNKTGRTLVFDCPLVSDWLEKDLDPENGIENPASEKVVRNIKKQIRGFIYQPYNASGVMIEPAVELGDGIFINNIYSGIYSMDVKFSKTEAYISDISAPSEEEIDHEFPYESQSQRESKRIRRRVKDTESRLEVQAGEISAKVSSVVGDKTSSFSWSLKEDKWEIRANGKLILKVSEDGLYVNGDGRFTGNVYAGNIQKGGSGDGRIGTGILSSGVQTSLAHADFSDDVFNGRSRARQIACDQISSDEYLFDGRLLGMSTIAYVGVDGQNHSINVVTWRIR